jgi:hypothetical protein
VARTYAAARSNLNRYLAAEENVRFLEPRRLERDLLIDEFLRAQSRRADAESAYYGSLVDYNKAITNLLFREERLLEHDNITLMEGPWTADAYADAEEKAWARSYAFENEHLETKPAPFISPVPVDGPEFSRPIDAAEWPPANELPEQQMPLELPPEVKEVPPAVEAPPAPDASDSEP